MEESTKKARRSVMYLRNGEAENLDRVRVESVKSECEVAVVWNWKV